MNIFDYIGLLGAFIIAYIYFYSQVNSRFLSSPSFFLSNIVGSSLIVASLMLSSLNIPSLVIELLWISISIFGIINRPLNKNDVYQNLTLPISTDLLSIHPNPSLSELSKTQTTLILSPALFKPSPLSVADIDDYYHFNSHCVFMAVPNRLCLVSDIENLLSSSVENTNVLDSSNTVLFIITGINGQGTIKSTISKKNNDFELSLDAASYIAEQELFSSIIIDAPSFSHNSDHSCQVIIKLMQGNQPDSFTPVVINACTPINASILNSCTIRIGNTPTNSCNYFPVSIKAK